MNGLSTLSSSPIHDLNCCCRSQHTTDLSVFVVAAALRLESSSSTAPAHYDTLLLALVVYFYLDECALEMAPPK